MKMKKDISIDREIVGLIKLKAQMIANNICDHFKLKRIPIEFSNRLKRSVGIYYGDKIRLKGSRNRSGVDTNTLLHELAHHLKDERYKQRIAGYFKKEMWPKMEYSDTNKNGKVCYATIGKLEPIYLKIGTSHDKLFERCLKDIANFYYPELRKVRR